MTLNPDEISLKDIADAEKAFLYIAEGEQGLDAQTARRHAAVLNAVGQTVSAQESIIWALQKDLYACESRLQARKKPQPTDSNEKQQLQLFPKEAA